MKIALCFSGQSRSVRQGFEYYARNLLHKYDVDVFVHSWCAPENEEFLKFYRPKKYLFENRIENTFDQKYGHRCADAVRHPPYSTASMFYSIFKACELLADEKYDWVIRSRSDFALNRSFDFENLDSSKLYMPNDWIPEGRDGGNDQFAFSSMDNMKLYCSTFKNLDLYFESGCVFNGENMLSANLRFYGLTRDKISYQDMNHPFYKGRYDGMRNSLIRTDYHKWLGYQSPLTFREIKGKVKYFLDRLTKS